MGAKNGQQDFNVGSRGRALATLCVLHVLVVAALAATREDLDAALDHKEDAVRDFKASLESAARDINLYNSTCEMYSACSAEPVSYTHLTLPTKRIV